MEALRPLQDPLPKHPWQCPPHAAADQGTVSMPGIAGRYSLTPTGMTDHHAGMTDHRFRHANVLVAPVGQALQLPGGWMRE